MGQRPTALQSPEESPSLPGRGIREVPGVTPALVKPQRVFKDSPTERLRDLPSDFQTTVTIYCLSKRSTLTIMH